MTDTARDLRERALRIREVSLGFSDEVSRTLLELAKDMEAQAEQLEKDKPEKPE